MTFTYSFLLIQVSRCNFIFIWRLSFYSCKIRFTIKWHYLLFAIPINKSSYKQFFCNSLNAVVWYYTLYLLCKYKRLLHSNLLSTFLWCYDLVWLCRSSKIIWHAKSLFCFNCRIFFLLNTISSFFPFHL